MPVPPIIRQRIDIAKEQLQAEADEAAKQALRADQELKARTRDARHRYVSQICALLPDDLVPYLEVDSVSVYDYYNLKATASLSIEGLAPVFIELRGRCKDLHGPFEIRQLGPYRVPQAVRLFENDTLTARWAATKRIHEALGDALVDAEAQQILLDQLQAEVAAELAAQSAELNAQISEWAALPPAPDLTDAEREYATRTEYLVQTVRTDSIAWGLVDLYRAVREDLQLARNSW